MRRKVSRLGEIREKDVAVQEGFVSGRSHYSHSKTYFGLERYPNISNRMLEF